MLQDADLLSVQEVRTKVNQAWAAFQTYRHYSQEQVDAIVDQTAASARAAARRLAELAVAETRYGNVESKIAKNLLAADVLPRRLRGMKTVGVLRELPAEQIVEIAEPVGVVAAILPTTNPTSTAIYKTLISLKAGNAVVLSPHPRARGCTCATIDVLQQAAVRAGAPPELIQCLNAATIDGTTALMRHPRTGVILATGGTGIVKAAYSSGKPALGVGPGNVPVLIDESAAIPEAVAKVVAGKSFDYGTVCSSEQTIVAVTTLRERILAELRAQKAHLCDAAQSAALARVLLDDRLVVHPDCVGQAPEVIAAKAGFSIAPGTSILVTEIAGTGKEHPLSAEKLSPVLAVYFVPDFPAALDACEAILRFGGLGHTSVIHAADRQRILEYGRRMPAFRVLVNTSSPQGSTGITTNVLPAMTLGCGAIAGNATSDNIGPQHLFNIKRVAWQVREPEDAFEKEPAAAGAAGREAIVAAVERYLASRGVAPAAPPSSVAALVDRFLASRKEPALEAPQPPEASAAPSCGCAVAAAQPAPAPAPAAAPPSPPPAPPSPVPIAGFVCEADVRLAMRESKKIYIGPKTIVTPSARDLAAQHDILVIAQRT